MFGTNATWQVRIVPALLYDGRPLEKDSPLWLDQGQIMARPGHEVTNLLRLWNEGDPDALNRLMPLVYDELYHEARRHFGRERESHTLQPTALVHEVYLRLVGESEVRWQNRAHFFGSAARLMRRVLVDHARERQALKRGGAAATIALSDVSESMASAPEIDVLALDSALERLAGMDERQCRIVELRFFAGLTIPETAHVLEIGLATVNREWRTAKAWLLSEIRGSA